MRKLSSFQSKAWMNRISKFRKYKNQAKGIDHPKARLGVLEVDVIRGSNSAGRMKWCTRYDISERHWYHIRQGKRWSHL